MGNNVTTETTVADIMAPMFAITMEFDAILSELLRSQFGMSLADFKVLRAIYMLQRSTQLDIARFTHVTEAAVSKRVKKLIDEQLIQKETDPSDKRKVVLSLSLQGKKKMQVIQRRVLKNTEKMLHDFTTTNRVLLSSLLQEVFGMIIKESPRESLLQQKHCVEGNHCTEPN
jgi:DNA-binding MarR family transcriptional regulator